MLGDVGEDFAGSRSAPSGCGDAANVPGRQESRSMASRQAGVERFEDVEGGEEKAPEPQVGSSTETSTMAFQKARTSSGPSLLAITSWANFSMLRLQVMRSLIDVISPASSLARISS